MRLAQPISADRIVLYSEKLYFFQFMSSGFSDQPLCM